MFNVLFLTIYIYLIKPVHMNQLSNLTDFQIVCTHNDISVELLTILVDVGPFINSSTGVPNYVYYHKQFFYLTELIVFENFDENLEVICDSAPEEISQTNPKCIFDKNLLDQRHIWKFFADDNIIFNARTGNRRELFLDTINNTQFIDRVMLWKTDFTTFWIMQGCLGEDEVLEGIIATGAFMRRERNDDELDLFPDRKTCEIHPGYCTTAEFNSVSFKNPETLMFLSLSAKEFQSNFRRTKTTVETLEKKNVWWPFFMVVGVLLSYVVGIGMYFVAKEMQ